MNLILHNLRGGARRSDDPFLADLLAFYRYDGNAQDASENARHLSVAISGSFVTGLIGDGWYGGMGDLIANLPSGNAAYTKSMWVQPGPDAAAQDLMAGWLISGGATKFFDLTVSSRDDANGGVVVSATARNGGLFGQLATAVVAVSDEFEWIHVVAVVTASDLVLWVNGVQVASAGGGIDATFAHINWNLYTVGVQATAGDLWGMWSRELTAGEIGALYAGGSGYDPFA